MSHKVVEIFQSIQSEGFYSGCAANFVRFYGCNRTCNFGTGFVCDEPLHTMPKQVIIMGDEDILSKLNPSIKLVVLTGGEPSINNLRYLIKLLQGKGFVVAVETNGFCLENIFNADHITYSPKHMFKGGNITKELIDGFSELKVLAGVDNPLNSEEWSRVEVDKYIQPIAKGDKPDLDNIRYCHEFVIENPDWMLSLQSHKFYGAE